MGDDETTSFERCQLVVDIGRILFIDRVETVPPHKAMIPVFAAAIHGDFEITIDEEAKRLRTWIAPPDVVRSVEGFGGQMAVMPMDPVVAPAKVRSPRRCLDALTTLVSGFDPAAWSELSEGVGMAATTQERPEPLVEAMRLVRASSDENVPGREIARDVGYSLPHLQHLFRSHAGTSIRSYRTWSRFVTLARSYATNRSLTDAGAAAGFFDSAHLTRSFTKTFGVPPSLVFNNEVEIHVVSES